MKNKEKLRPLSLREIQLRELELLKQFDKFCQDNHLEYFLCGGTLLGAIRHKGFIPWDDDIDVFMPRPEFERLKCIILSGKNNINGNEFCSSFAGNGYFPFIKLEDKDTYIPDENYAKRGYGRVWIDIFSIDGFSKNTIINFIRIKICNLFRRCIFISFISFSNILRDKQCSVLKKIKRCIGRFLILPFSKRMLSFLLDCVSRMWSYEISSFVGGIQWGMYEMNEIIPKSGVARIDVEFEGKIFPGLKCYKQYLTQLYGNYMELPPLEKRSSHMNENNVFEIIDLDEE